MGLSAAPSAEECVTSARTALEKKYTRTFGPDSTVTGPISIQEAEAEGLRAIKDCSHCPQKPFGYVNHEWLGFVREVTPLDCVVFFRNDPAAWKQLLGAQGYAIIRAGKVHKIFITLVS